MDIHVASGIGTGPTKMAAFDSALNKSGVANYNLIRLSSVIPADSKVINHKQSIPKLSGKWGDRLYVVLAEIRVDTPNVEAWAGIGWVQDDKTGKGLFVEHEGLSKQAVEKDIEQSLTALMETRGVNFGAIRMKVIGTTCEHQPVCALVIAVFQATNWPSKVSLFRKR